MILTANLLGGLGNQLFQVAAAYAYAKKYGFQLIFKESWPCDQNREPIWSYYFLGKDLPWKLVPAKQFQSFKWFSIKEPSFAFAPIVAPLDRNALPFTMLEGYYQSSQYFKDYTEDIRSILQIRPHYIEKAHASLDHAGVKEPDGWIAAHVRRGDYLDPMQAPIHSVTSKDYFKRARARIQKDIGLRTVCWITDDMEWVYRNLYEQGDVVLNGDTMTDFAALSLFRYMILSNSTFSWWAAWLNPLGYDTPSRRICCPSKWFGSSGPPSYESIYEADWIRIDTISG